MVNKPIINNPNYSTHPPQLGTKATTNKGTTRFVGILHIKANCTKQEFNID